MGGRVERREAEGNAEIGFKLAVQKAKKKNWSPIGTIDRFSRNRVRKQLL